MNWAPGQKSAATNLCSPRTLRLLCLKLNFRRLILHMRFRVYVSRRLSRESEHNPLRIETEHRAQPTIAGAGCGLDYTTRLRGRIYVTHVYQLSSQPLLSSSRICIVSRFTINGVGPRIGPHNSTPGRVYVTHVYQQSAQSLLLFSRVSMRLTIEGAGGESKKTESDSTSADPGRIALTQEMN